MRTAIVKISILSVLLITIVMICVALFKDHKHEFAEKHTNDTTIQNLENKNLDLVKKGISNLNNVVDSPNFYSVTNHNNPFHIKAKYAKKDDNVIHLQDMKTTLSLAKNEMFILHAGKGVLDVMSKNLYVDGGVSFYAQIVPQSNIALSALHMSHHDHMEQYKVFADKVLFNYAAHLVSASGGIKMSSHDMNIASGDMKLDLKKKICVFKKGVKIVISSNNGKLFGYDTK